MKKPVPPPPTPPRNRHERRKDATKRRHQQPWVRVNHKSEPTTKVYEIGEIKDFTFSLMRDGTFDLQCRLRTIPASVDAPLPTITGRSEPSSTTKEGT